MAKVISAEEAARLVKDNQTVAILGSGGGVCEPTLLLQKLGERYLAENAPKALTIFHANGIGDKDSIGTDCLAYEGLVRRDIGGHWAMAPKMAQLALEEKIEAYNFPQGVLSQMYQAVAAHKPGVITKTGLHTFIDPRLEGGRMNQSAKYEEVERRPCTLDWDSLAMLEDAIAKIRQDEEVRAVVLQSASPKSFVVGANIKVLETFNAENIMDWVKNGHRIFNQLQQLPVPVIARVESYALGGGLELAMACDMIIACEEANTSSVCMASPSTLKRLENFFAQRKK